MDGTLARLAAQQYGVVSRAQAIAAGFTRGAIQREVAAGRWERLHRGVYAVAGSPRSWRRALMAACLACGDSAAAYASAARLWRIAGFERAPVEVLVPLPAAPSPEGVIVHRTRTWSPNDLTTVEAIPVTTPARTLIDLAGVVESEALEDALDDVLRQGLVSLSRLRWCLDEIGGKGRAGMAVLSSLVEARLQGGSVPHSVFEGKLRRLMRKAGLPEPVPQHEVRSGGRLIARPDFAYPDHKIAIEADGYRWHSGRTRFDADLARRNALTNAGWRVIHVTWTALVHEPEHVVRTIEEALRGAPTSTGNGQRRAASSRKANGRDAMSFCQP